jgi:hypothetical protein
MIDAASKKAPGGIRARIILQQWEDHDISL